MTTRTFLTAIGFVVLTAAFLTVAASSAWAAPRVGLVPAVTSRAASATRAAADVIAAPAEALTGKRSAEKAGKSVPDGYAVDVSDVTWNDAKRGRSLPVRIYRPTGNAANAVGPNDRFPVIVFSTGLGRSRTDCAYLGNRWASAGYAAVFVQHPGSDRDARGLRPRKDLQRAFYSPDNTRNRPLDIIFVLDQLEALSHDNTPLGRHLDMKHVGASGHDFGSQTVLALAGQLLPGELSFNEHRIKAVVAMGSPVPVGQVPLDQAYAKIALPVFHITGTADRSIVATTQPSQRRLPFDYTSGNDQFLMTLQGGDHMTYSGHMRPSNSGNDAMFQRIIAEASVVFWDAYLKDRASAKKWLVDGGLKDYLGRTAQFEEKLAQ